MLRLLFVPFFLAGTTFAHAGDVATICFGASKQAAYPKTIKATRYPSADTWQ